MNRIVLVIEDNPDVRDNIREILELSNYEVHAASDGKEGLEMARRISPDIILCDITIPELDGYGVLRGLNNNPGTRHIPFVFVTSKAEKSDVRRGMDMGADDYLLKPFNGHELLSMVSARLTKRESIKNNPGGAGYGESGVHSGFHETLHMLGEKITLKKIRKKDLLFAEEDTANHLYFIISGKIKVSKSNEQGKEYITRIYGSKEFIGYSALLRKNKYEETAIAIEDCEVAGIYIQDFLSLLHQHQDLITRFIHLITSNFLELNNKLIGLAYNSARKRVAEGILYIAQKYNDQLSDGLLFPICRDDLSAVSGVSPESVSRNLTDFRAEQLIELHNGQMKILSLNKLITMKN